LPGNLDGPVILQGVEEIILVHSSPGDPVSWNQSKGDTSPTKILYQHFGAVCGNDVVACSCDNKHTSHPHGEYTVDPKRNS